MQTHLEDEPPRSSSPEPTLDSLESLKALYRSLPAPSPLSKLPLDARYPTFDPSDVGGVLPPLMDVLAKVGAKLVGVKKEEVMWLLGTLERRLVAKEKEMGGVGKRAREDEMEF